MSYSAIWINNNPATFQEVITAKITLMMSYLAKSQAEPDVILEKVLKSYD